MQEKIKFYREKGKCLTMKELCGTRVRISFSIQPFYNKCPASMGMSEQRDRTLTGRCKEKCTLRIVIGYRNLLFLMLTV